MEKIVRLLSYLNCILLDKFLGMIFFNVIFFRNYKKILDIFGIFIVFICLIIEKRMFR